MYLLFIDKKYNIYKPFKKNHISMFIIIIELKYDFFSKTAYINYIYKW
jgi:hypothetical protein